ncbi:MAG: hypothetical protein JJT93_01040 [Gammaproteobacteria bacterium]|nr:hypothetical protein [Gammaproteobacteria bacterium]TVQ48607.1 MAG: hypothetical protein EA371_05550 [Gammaproteobacteria bacterium]
MASDLDIDSLTYSGDDAPVRDLRDIGPRDDGGARRRLEAVLEERRVRRELAALDMDSFDFEDLPLYE